MRKRKLTKPSEKGINYQDTFDIIQITPEVKAEILTAFENEIGSPVTDEFQVVIGSYIVHDDKFYKVTREYKNGKVSTARTWNYEEIRTIKMYLEYK